MSIVSDHQELVSTTRLQAILDASLNGIMAFTAVRSDDGQIIDFTCTSANRAACHLLNKPADELVGQRMLTLFTANREVGFFDAYVITVETGVNQRLERYYEADGLQAWYDVNAVKFEDGIVVTFIDISLQKQAQLAQQQQASRLQSVLNGSLTSIALMTPVRDETGTIIDFYFADVNASLAQLTSRSVESLRGQRVSTYFPYYKTGGLFDFYKQAIETGQPLRFELPYYADGVRGWFDIQVAPQSDGIVVNFVDISPVKKAQMAREQTSSLLQTVMDNSLTGITKLDAIRDEANRLIDFRFALVNQTMRQITGRRPEDLLGRLQSEVFPHQMTNGLFDRYRAVAETGEPARFEWSNTDGTIWFDISVVQHHHGVIITFLDITAIKKAQLDQQQQAQDLKQIVDGSLNGLLACDPVRDDNGDIYDLRMSLANQAASRLNGRPVDQLIGRTLLEAFPSLPRSGVMTYYLHTARTGEIQRFETAYYFDGLQNWYDIAVTPLGEGRILISFVDISSSKHLQQQLELSVADLKRSNESLQQFAYVASHDLQEPLRKIQAFGDLLGEQFGPLVGDDGRTLIQRMQGAAARMQDLIKALLMYSRTATHQQPYQQVDLNKLTREVLGDLETAITEHQAQIHVDPLPTLTGDATQLRQLFQNLLSNALKFTIPREVARIAIHARQVDPGDLPVPLFGQSRSFVALDIADNGIGFDMKYQERIFRLFERLHGRSQYTGTGIGLAICKRVVDNHGGYITARSEPGQGATFTVYLPLPN
ncbi:PAS/PAC sensor signal transduction histidine kinase [Fibrisoma limi BUZ 3]|uniref:histidine kinase n=1 Tax=Fibrisoma limi BUZ 3 TaxID=1185876 RepID=I2GF56_9BACT|nr:PAS domain-containing protein [Fibrisoma limi]CCH52531.1 PAS/PAC sensor signal transduction histidine kinase [Fibrisoma limi BUZ 3]